jgi:erythromycin esterase-like protein
VRAAKKWGENCLVMDINPSISQSAGDLLSKVSKKSASGQKDYGLLFRSNTEEMALTDLQQEAKKIMARPMIQRFIGVIYAKNTERLSHYTECKLANQYDFLIHVDETSAVHEYKPKKAPVRPGCTDYSKWDNIQAPEE